MCVSLDVSIFVCTFARLCVYRCLCIGALCIYVCVSAGMCVFLFVSASVCVCV